MKVHNWTQSGATSRKVNSKQIAPNLRQKTGTTVVVQKITERMEAQEALKGT